MSAMMKKFGHAIRLATRDRSGGGPGYNCTSYSYSYELQQRVRLYETQQFEWHEDGAADLARALVVEEMMAARRSGPLRPRLHGNSLIPPSSSSAAAVAASSSSSCSSTEGSGAPPRPSHPQVEPTPELAPGTAVEIEGLISAPQHNGKPGIVEGFDAAKGRYVVRVIGQAITMNLKHANLRRGLGAQALTFAAQQGDVAAMGRLLDGGADPNALV
eukprot:COSAG01_NODE_12051_length_1807_cov_1.581967_2_plen_215_part_01